MTVYETVVQRRSIRQYADRAVPRDLLERCMNAGRLAPVSGNLQPLVFVAVTDRAMRERIFPLTRWAAHLKEWNPKPEGQPRAYIAILVRKDVGMPAYVNYDVAFAAAQMTLVAADEGVGSCALGAFDRGKIAGYLGVPEGYDLPLLLALGYPAEHPQVEAAGEDVHYWRDERGVHHVPKRPVSAVTRWERF